MKVAEQTISICGLRFYAFHGVEPQERITGAWYEVDVELQVQASLAVRTDDLSGTVNYADVAILVREEMQIPRNLLENVAGRIAGRIMDSFPAVGKAAVTVAKKNPPVAVAARSASFKIVVERD